MHFYLIIDVIRVTFVIRNYSKITMICSTVDYAMLARFYFLEGVGGDDLTKVLNVGCVLCCESFLSYVKDSFDHMIKGSKISILDFRVFRKNVRYNKLQIGNR